MRYKKYWIVLTAIIFISFTGCTTTNDQLSDNTNNGNMEVEAVEPSDTEATYQDISPEEAKKLLEDGEDVILLDVRTPEEYEEEHIPGSILIPLDTIESKVEDQIEDKDTTIVVYCRTGRRSSMAAEQLVKMGYSKVYNLGGILDWSYEKEAGK